LIPQVPLKVSVILYARYIFAEKLWTVYTPEDLERKSILSIT
jgi:hypothetical protein